MTALSKRKELEKLADLLTDKAESYFYNVIELFDAVKLTEELESIRQIKQNILNNHLLDNESTDKKMLYERENAFKKQIEHAEQIIVDLMLRVVKDPNAGFGKQLYDLCDALKASAGLLKVVVALILTYQF